MSDSTVPFGKYRGRPVEDMLADQSYMLWLEAQPWFRERFSHLLRQQSQADQPEQTPAHNRLQALFLRGRFIAAFAKIADPKFENHKNDLTQFVNRTIGIAETDLESNELQYPSVLAEIQNAKVETPKFYFKRSFECKLQNGGVVDVIIEAGWLLTAFCFELHPEFKRYLPTPYEEKRFSRFSIEIKPNVADDYPSVLRQMRRSGAEYLFTERYDGEGVTQEEFVEIFRASGITVVFKANVDAMLATLP